MKSVSGFALASTSRPPRRASHLAKTFKVRQASGIETLYSGSLGPANFHVAHPGLMLSSQRCWVGWWSGRAQAYESCSSSYERLSSCLEFGICTTSNNRGERTQRKFEHPRSQATVTAPPDHHTTGHGGMTLVLESSETPDAYGGDKALPEPLGGSDSLAAALPPWVFDMPGGSRLWGGDLWLPLLRPAAPKRSDGPGVVAACFCCFWLMADRDPRLVMTLSPSSTPRQKHQNGRPGNHLGTYL